MNTRPHIALTAVSLVLLVVPAQPATIHVPGDHSTIQAGIDAASAGDTVLVACGTYYEHDITMKSGVCLTGETGQAACVTVDAKQQGRVFCCDHVDRLASIVGFTITGGFATGP
jgi:pectin methylesterase-like acyl-CoA thioesterase